MVNMMQEVKERSVNLSREAKSVLKQDVLFFKGLFTLNVFYKTARFCLALCQWWRAEKWTEWVEIHSVHFS